MHHTFGIMMPVPQGHDNGEYFLILCPVVALSGHHGVAVHTIPPDQVRLIGSTGLDSGLVLVERSVKEWVGVLRDSRGGLLGTVLHTRRDLY